MITLTYQKTVRAAKLAEELRAAGVTIDDMQFTDTAVMIRVPANTVESVVSNIIEAHNNSVLSNGEQAVVNDDNRIEALRAEYQALKNDCDTARTLLGTDAQWQALTVAQRNTRTRQVLLGLTNHLEEVADALRVIVKRSTGS